MSKGVLVVYSGASGVGKGTIMKELLRLNENIRLSISATTRAPRPTERDGVEYFFVTKDKFENMIENDEFMEYAQYCSNYYGTPKQAVFDMLDKGIDVFLEIDVQGGIQVMEKFPDCTSIFILPPSEEELMRRLKGRGTESDDVIAQRLLAAKDEIASKDKYSYNVINDDVTRAANEILDILKREKV